MKNTVKLINVFYLFLRNLVKHFVAYKFKISLRLVEIL